MTDASPPRLIKPREVSAKTSMSRTAIWKRLKNGTFPKPVKLGDDGKRIAFVEQEIDAWIAARLVEREAA